MHLISHVQYYHPRVTEGKRKDVEECAGMRALIRRDR